MYFNVLTTRDKYSSCCFKFNIETSMIFSCIFHFWNIRRWPGCFRNIIFESRAKSWGWSIIMPTWKWLEKYHEKLKFLEWRFLWLVIQLPNWINTYQWHKTCYRLLQQHMLLPEHLAFESPLSISVNSAVGFVSGFYFQIQYQEVPFRFLDEILGYQLHYFLILFQQRIM